MIPVSFAAAALAFGLWAAPAAVQAASAPAPALDGPTLIADVAVTVSADTFLDATGAVLFLETADGDDVPLNATFSIFGFTDSGFHLSVFDAVDFSDILAGDGVGFAQQGASLEFAFATTFDKTGLFGDFIYVALTGLLPDNLLSMDYSESDVSGFATTAQVAPVPLPLTAPMLLVALAAFGVVARHRG